MINLSIFVFVHIVYVDNKGTYFATMDTFLQHIQQDIYQQVANPILASQKMITLRCKNDDTLNIIYNPLFIFVITMHHIQIIVVQTDTTYHIESMQ